MSDAHDSQTAAIAPTTELIGQIVAGAYKWDMVASHALFPGAEARFATGHQIMLAMFTMQPGCLIPPHSHMHEQAGYWLEGDADFTIGDATYRVGPGDSYLVPSGVVHSVQVLDKTARALDVFSPPREDYLKYRGR
jgi:quercetin dioxygenase-like cupin family protein